MGFLLDDNENTQSHYLIYGKDLCCFLVTKYEEMYAENLTVYGVVGLLHLGEDSYFFKETLDNLVFQLQKLSVST